MSRGVPQSESPSERISLVTYYVEDREKTGKGGSRKTR